MEQSKQSFTSSAVATVLGAEDTPSPCRIVGVSWSGMRIAMKRPSPRDAQLYVQWADGFFVGNNCCMAAKGEEFFLRLQLVACSYAPLPRMMGFLVTRPKQAAINCGAELVRALQMFACSVLGARLRPMSASASSRAGL
ncbi:hypothetical protein SBA4_2920004 [Candidatus Sulfopaludibacter sp. SbA4]|nr:hypothetical protein SBA4_2920004 [Candidatus Sulfopaludibacter sp. SbA4]